jgi:hypothetical protein
MNTEQTKLIYIVSAPRQPTQQSTASSNPPLPNQIQTGNYERGSIDTTDDRKAKEMCDERKRRVTFEIFNGWKHSTGLNLLLARYGFYSGWDSSSSSLLICAFCKSRFHFKEDRKTARSEDTGISDNELNGLHFLIRQHQVHNSTCPRSLGLEGDNIPVSRRPTQNMTDWKDLAQNEEDKEDTATDEYCNEESELRLQKLVDELDPPYTNDLFGDMLPLIGPLNLKRTARECTAINFQGNKLVF